VPAAPPRQLADLIDLRDHRRSPATSSFKFWRRRIVVLAALLVVGLALGAGLNRLVAAPVSAPQVAGTAVLEPGHTLWGLAADHTPTGQDVRATLRDIQVLNGFDTATVPVWTVVLLPATD
jgi:hypothetical protein